MAVIGTSAGGYATVLPTQGNPIGEAMSNVENSAFRYSAQKMAKDKMKQDAERDLYDRRRQEFEANKQWSIENPYVSLGNGSEGVIKQSYMNLKDMASQSRALALSTGDPKYQVEYDNAVMGAKSLAQMPTAINSVREKIATDPSSFNPVSLKKTQDFIDSELVAKRGENGTVVYDQVKKDENGNVKVIETGLTPARIKQLTETIPALNFNGSEGLKGESVQEKFNKLVDKPRKVTKIENGIEKTEEIVVGAEQLSKEFADQMIQDRNNLYNIFYRIGIDPENQNNYKDPKKVKEARSFIERNLFASNATTTSTEPDYEGQKLALQKAESAYNKKRDIIEDSKTTDAPKAIPLTVTRYAGTGIDPETGSEQEAGVFKIGITPVKGSPVKAITHNPKTGVTTAYILDTKSNFLTQSGKDKIASGEDKKLIDSDYINSEFKTRPVSSKKNSSHFNRIIRTEITKDGKNGYNDYSDFYRSFAPAIKATKSVSAKSNNSKKVDEYGVPIK